MSEIVIKNIYPYINDSIIIVDVGGRAWSGYQVLNQGAGGERYYVWAWTRIQLPQNEP